MWWRTQVRQKYHIVLAKQLSKCSQPKNEKVQVFHIEKKIIRYNLIPAVHFINFIWQFKFINKPADLILATETINDCYYHELVNQQLFTKEEEISSIYSFPL